MSKVCFLSTVHDDTNTRVFHREAVALANAGYDVTYYTPRATTRNQNGVKIKKPGFVDWRIFEHTPMLINRLIFSLLLFYFASKDADYDVYHFHDPELLPSGFITTYFIEGKFVYDAHENASEAVKHKEWAGDIAATILSFALKLNNRICTTRMDGIITAANDIESVFDHHDNVVVVNNFPKEKWAYLDYEPRETEKLQIVYSGLLTENRGILTTIEAVKSLPPEVNVVLKLAGNCDSDNMRKQIEQAAMGSNRIEYLGYLPTIEDVFKLFYDSDVGIFCFHSDAINLEYGAYRSNKLFEYMCANLAIIVSSIGNWPEIINEHDCGIAVKPEVSNIRDGITFLYNHPSRRKSLGENGRVTALSKFTWESQEELLIQFYEDIINKC